MKFIANFETQNRTDMRRFTIFYLIIIFPLTVLFSSCATILNQPVQRIFISVDKNISSVSVNKSLATDSSLTRIDAAKNYYIVRSKEPLAVELQIDSTKKTILLPSRNSTAYWANIYFNDGLGMLVDKNNVKRYAYSKRNYFAVKDTMIKRSSFAPITKGTANLSFSWPFTSFFNLQSETGNYNSTGPLGLQTGVDYFYKNNRYVSLNFGAATDIFGEYLGKGYYESANLLFANLMNNNIAGRFDFGYGINLSKFEWRRKTIGDTINLDKTIKSTIAGFSLSIQYRFGDYFRFGILYQPGIFGLNATPVLKYQDYISLNLTWKLPLKNGMKE